MQLLQDMVTSASSSVSSLETDTVRSQSGPANNDGAGAAARALGVVEIVDMIIDCLCLDVSIASKKRKWRVYPKSRDDWVACGALARGVNRTLRQAVDKAIGLCLFDPQNKEVCHLSRDQPIAYLRIIANTPTTLAGTQSVRIWDFRSNLGPQKLRYITSIICSLSASLVKLDVGIHSLSSLSDQIALNPHFAFPNLRTLIFRKSATHAEGNRDIALVLKAVRTLQTFTLVSDVTLDLATTNSPEGSEEHCYLIHNHMLVAMSVCSAHVKTLTVEATWAAYRELSAAQLALLFRHFSGVQRLSLNVARPVPLYGVLPPGVEELTMQGPCAAMPDFLKLLLDDTQIPHLRVVPTIVINEDYGWAYDRRTDLRSLTKQAVDALKARPEVQDDDEKYAALLRLGE